MTESRKPASTRESSKSKKAGPTLNEERRKDAGMGPTPPEAWVIHEIVREDGEREIRRSVNSLAWSGFGAGLSMGFSFLTMAQIRAALPPMSWAHLLSGFGYSIGFLIAVLGRQQLFTESTLTAALPFLTKRNSKSLFAMLRLWVVVLAANLLGTFVFAAVISYPNLFHADVAKALGDVASEALRDGFAAMTMKAVLSGWLIALMVWLLPAAGGSRPLIIIIITYVISVCGFSHIIAGSVDGVYVVQMGAATWQEFAARFFAPTLLGNIVGGVALVAVLNYGQVATDVEPA